MLTLAQLPLWAVSILVVFYVLISVIMILAVLIQRPQGGGLSTAFGAGAGSGQTAFGTKIGDALTIFTITVFVLFLGSSIALVYLLRPDDAGATPPPAATGTEAPAEPAGQLPGAEAPTGETPAAEPAAAPETPAETGTDQPAGDSPAQEPPAQNPDTPASGAPATPPTTPGGR